VDSPVEAVAGLDCNLGIVLLQELVAMFVVVAALLGLVAYVVHVVVLALDPVEGIVAVAVAGVRVLVGHLVVVECGECLKLVVVVALDRADCSLVGVVAVLLALVVVVDGDLASFAVGGASFVVGVVDTFEGSFVGLA